MAVARDSPHVTSLRLSAPRSSGIAEADEAGVDPERGVMRQKPSGHNSRLEDTVSEGAGLNGRWLNYHGGGVAAVITAYY